MSGGATVCRSCGAGMGGNMCRKCRMRETIFALEEEFFHTLVGAAITKKDKESYAADEALRLRELLLDNLGLQR